MQALHAVEPLATWKDPAAHGEHSAEPFDGAKEPAPHAVGIADPAAHAWPAGQGLHVSALVAFTTSLHEPASHSVTLAAPASQ